MVKVEVEKSRGRLISSCCSHMQGLAQGAWMMDRTELNKTKGAALSCHHEATQFSNLVLQTGPTGCSLPNPCTCIAESGMQPHLSQSSMRVEPLKTPDTAGPTPSEPVPPLLPTCLPRLPTALSLSGRLSFAFRVPPSSHPIGTLESDPTLCQPHGYAASARNERRLLQILPRQINRTSTAIPPTPV